MTLLNNKGYVLKRFFYKAEIFANYCKDFTENYFKN